MRPLGVASRAVRWVRAQRRSRIAAASDVLVLVGCGAAVVAAAGIEFGPHTVLRMASVVIIAGLALGLAALPELVARAVPDRVVSPASRGGAR